jgi:soluble lytic murein transglycosylase-like protein
MFIDKGFYYRYGKKIVPMSKSKTVILAYHIVAVSNKNNVDPILTYHVIEQESAFIVNNGSRAGAKSLMQVMPLHFKHCGISYAYNPFQNTTCGTGILEDALKESKGNLTIALSIYNSGRKDGYLKFAETKKYVATIRAKYEKTKRELGYYG